MNFKLTVYIFLFILLNISCSKKNVLENTPEPKGDNINSDISINSVISKGVAEGNFETGYDASDLINNNQFTNKVILTFSNNEVIVENAINGVLIQIDEGRAVVQSTTEGVEYELKGQSTNGFFKINSTENFKLLLNGIVLTNPNGPVINIQSKKKVFIEVANSTLNKLIDGVTYSTSTEDQKGTLFSEGSLIFSGSGNLTIEGINKHAIVSDKYIRILEGNISITTAASDGIHSNDGIYIDGGNIDVKANSDGIEAEKGPVIINSGVINIKVADDGIVASYEGNDAEIKAFLNINGGEINIETTGNGGEGIESKDELTINDGQIFVKSIDDGLNAKNAIYINGGLMVIHSLTNDGIDSNGVVKISGGSVYTIGAGVPEGGIDCDRSEFKITGGKLIAIGGSNSLPTSSVSTQASVMHGELNANEIYSLIDDQNQELLTFKAWVSPRTTLYSAGNLKVNKSYRIVKVNQIDNSKDFHGLYLEGVIKSASILKTFSQNELVSKFGGDTGPGGK